MKRVRHEQIMSSVNSYIKRRSYNASESSKTRTLDPVRDVYNLRSASASSSVNGASPVNVMSYSGVSSDASSYDQQFVRFKQFINDSPDIHQSELRGMLFPVFAHIYLELLCNGHKGPGHKFYGRHSAPFKEHHTEFLQNLEKLQTRNDVHTVKDVAKFRNQKYRISLNDSTIQHLSRHLQTEENVIILQILNHHISIKVKCGDSGELELNSPLTAQGSIPLSPPLTPDNKVIHNETTLLSLQQSIQKVKDGPHCLPSVCLYKLSNDMGRICSAELSTDNQRLCAGFEDSSIKIWGLTPDGLTETQPCSTTSQFPLAADYFISPNKTNESSDPITSQRPSLTLRGHNGAVYRAKFIDHNQHILSCSQDTTVRLWNISSCNNLVIYRGHNYPVWDIDVSQQSSQFATCSHDNTAKLWSTDRVYPIRSFIGHTSDVDCIQFHPNGTYIATGSTDKTVRLWSLTDGKCLRLFTGHRNSVLCLAFSPDGHYLASAGEDRRVKVWDLGSGRLYKELISHTGTVYSLSFNPSSTLLCSGGMGGTINVWDLTKQASTADTTPDKKCSPELLTSFPNKCRIISLKYAKQNVIYAAGKST